MPHESCPKCIEKDLKWDNILKIPKLIEYCGSVKSSEIISFKLLYYRIFASIYSITILLWNFVRFVRHHIAEYWLIFLSQWIAIIITIYFISISIINFKLLRYITINMINISSITSRDKDNCNNNTSSSNHNIDILFEGDGTLRFLSKFCSILFSMCFAPSVIITIANWTVNTDYNDYIESNDIDDIEKCLNDIHMHGVLLILLIIDYSLSMLYLSYNSIIYSLIFGLLFIIWSLIHYAAKLTNPWNKRYIYPTLNWKYPQTAILVTILLLIFMISTHYLSSYIKYNFILNKWWIKQQQQQQQQNEITNSHNISNANTQNKSSQQSFPPNTPSNIISIADANSQSNFSTNSNTNKLELALNNNDIKISNHHQNRLSFQQLHDEEEIDNNNNNNINNNNINNNNKNKNKSNDINLSIDNLEKLQSVSETE